jgi:hypothetical protein
MGEDYLILDAEGRGHYVGTVLSVALRTPGWFGEGDDRFYIDGAEEPQLKGTGSEDYFCDAWGFRQLNRPYYGITLNGSGLGRSFGDLITAYRWHINDPVHFQKSLKVTIEHKGNTFAEGGRRVSGFMERPDLFSSVAFWYQAGKARRFATLPPADERVIPQRVIELELSAQEARPEPATTTVEIQNGNYHAGKQLWAKFSVESGVLTVPFKLDKPLQGVATLHLTRSRDYGTFKVTLDGKPLAGLDPVDLYSPRVDPSEFPIGSLDLGEGSHELKFECVGKNERSTGYLLGADALEVREITPYLLKR